MCKQGSTAKRWLACQIFGALTAIAIWPGGPSPLAAPAKTVAAKPLAPDDVSILFPAPRRPGDLSKLIAVQDLMATDAAGNRTPVWPEPVFQNFVANTNGDSGHVGGSDLRMSLPPEGMDRAHWFVTGLRIDPGAPGLAPSVVAQFGQQPQIRLIAQPVIVRDNGTIQVADTAAHLIFDFDSGKDGPAQPGCFDRPKPDMAAFGQVLAEFADLRAKLEAGAFGGKKIVTAGKPLGIHPGLADAAAGKAMRDALKQILERHLSASRLGAMAVMTLPKNQPEPWMFLSMIRVGPGVVPQLPSGGFVPVPSPAFDGKTFTVALSAQNGFEVLPKPAPNNLNPITCRHAALRPPLPLDGRKGEATAALFATPQPTRQKTREIVDLVADPTRSHFFNTDCVSCHTETRRAMVLLAGRPVPGVDPKVLPKDDWNVRNFGWFPSFPTAQETATRRAAAETAAVLDFIRRNGLLKPTAPGTR